MQFMMILLGGKTRGQIYIHRLSWLGAMHRERENNISAILVVPIKFRGIPLLFQRYYAREKTRHCLGVRQTSVC